MYAHEFAPDNLPPDKPLECPQCGGPVGKFDWEFSEPERFDPSPGISVIDSPRVAGWALSPCGHSIRALDWEYCFWTVKADDSGPAHSASAFLPTGRYKQQ
jgi:hypothetical protein